MALTVAETIMIILAAGQLAYAALTYHRDRRGVMQSDPAMQPRRPLFIIGMFMLLTWAAVAFDLYDRHYAAQPLQKIVGTYGYDRPTSVYFLDADTEQLMGYGNNKLMLVVRVMYANIDRMTDKAIGKSGLYSIDGSKIRLVVPESALLSSLRVGRNDYEHDLVMLPPDVSPDNITDLADVKTVGGKILASEYSSGEVLIK